MPRPPRDWAAFGMRRCGSTGGRINRQERQAQSPGAEGGLCRWPDPPLERWQPKPGGRPYRKRYVGLVRQIARANGLHPIRDRAASC